MTEHGDTTMRWNRSRWVPSACGDRGLDRIGVGHGDDRLAPVLRRTARSTAPVMRVCISVNDSPPGNRKPLGYRCTVLHSGSLSRSFSSAPVHVAEVALEQAPVGRDPQPEGLGDRRRRLPGPLERRGVDRGDLSSSAAMRAAAASACVAALVGEVQARGPAGQRGAGRGRLAVADEQHQRRAWAGLGRRA